MKNVQQRVTFVLFFLSKKHEISVNQSLGTFSHTNEFQIIIMTLVASSQIV